MEAAVPPLPVYGPVHVPTVLAQVNPCEIAVGGAAVIFWWASVRLMVSWKFLRLDELITKPMVSGKVRSATRRTTGQHYASKL